MMHSQVKSKTGIKCDELMVPLIEAMNDIPGIETVGSCQEDDFGRTVVLFRHKDGVDALVSFLKREAPRMPALGWGKLQIHWKCYVPLELSSGTIHIQPAYLNELVEWAQGCAKRTWDS